MKKLCLTSFFLLLAFSVIYPQTNKLRIDINYPVPVGDNFIKEFYNGIIGFGGKYYFLEISNIDVGLSGNFEYFNSSILDVTILMFKPRISAQTKLWRFKPYIGIGYSYFNFILDTGSEIDKTSDGLNFNVGFSYNVFSSLYANFSYDYIKRRHEGNIQKSSYNLDIHVLNVGLGIQL